MSESIVRVARCSSSTQDYVHRDAYDTLFHRKVREAVRKSRTTVVGFQGFGGRQVALAAALVLAQFHSQEERVTVIDAPGNAESWLLEAKRMQPDVQVEVLSQMKITNRSDLISRPGVLLPVMHSMTKNRTSAAWATFAPIFRQHPHVIGFCYYDAYIKTMPVTDLVSAMDNIVVFHPTFDPIQRFGVPDAVG